MVIQKNAFFFKLNHGTFIKDVNSEIGVHVTTILCYLICLRHLIRPRAVKNPKRHIFLDACATYSESLSTYYDLSDESIKAPEEIYVLVNWVRN